MIDKLFDFFEHFRSTFWVKNFFILIYHLTASILFLWSQENTVDEYLVLFSAFSADSAPSPSTVEVKKLDPSRPVGEKILLVWDSSTPSSSSSSSSGGGGSGLHQVVYSVESRQWGSSKWNFEALVSNYKIKIFSLQKEESLYL